MREPQDDADMGTFNEETLCTLLKGIWLIGEDLHLKGYDAAEQNGREFKPAELAGLQLYRLWLGE